MTQLSLEFQAIASLGSGIFFGSFSLGLFPTFCIILLMEFIIFAWGDYKNDAYNMLCRILINVVFFFGWVVSRFLFLRESGFEECINQAKFCYETFPN